MRIVVFGANGPTGRLLTARSVAAGHDTLAVTRRPETFPSRDPRLGVVGGDVLAAAAEQVPQTAGDRGEKQVVDRGAMRVPGGAQLPQRDPHRREAPVGPDSAGQRRYGSRCAHIGGGVAQLPGGIANSRGEVADVADVIAQRGPQRVEVVGDERAPGGRARNRVRGPVGKPGGGAGVEQRGGDGHRSQAVGDGVVQHDQQPEPTLREAVDYLGAP